MGSKFLDLRLGSEEKLPCLTITSAFLNTMAQYNLWKDQQVLIAKSN